MDVESTVRHSTWNRAPFGRRVMNAEFSFFTLLAPRTAGTATRPAGRPLSTSPVSAADSGFRTRVDS